MLAHGLSLEESIGYLDRKKQDDIETWERWYVEVRRDSRNCTASRVMHSLETRARISFESRNSLSIWQSKYPLVYTTRDPRAIFEASMLR